MRPDIAEQGYISSLSAFLERYHPGLKIFANMDRDQWTVLLPEDPGRKLAEKAVDDAFERFKP